MLPPSPLRNQPTQLRAWRKRLYCVVCSPEGDWKLLVATEESAYTSRVALVVYGEDGNSGEIVLGEAGQSGIFQSGNQDQFKVSVAGSRP